MEKGVLRFGILYYLSEFQDWWVSAAAQALERVGFQTFLGGKHAIHFLVES